MLAMNLIYSERLKSNHELLENLIDWIMISGSITLAWASVFVKFISLL